MENLTQIETDKMADEWKNTDEAKFTSDEVQKLVNEAIESKLSSVQMQMAAMVEVLRNSGKGVAAMETEKDTEEDGGGDDNVGKEEGTGAEAGKGQGKKNRRGRQRPPVVVESVDYWDELLKDVVNILELEVSVAEDREKKVVNTDNVVGETEGAGDEKEGAVADENLNQGRKRAQILPPEESVTNLWGKMVDEFNPLSLPRFKPHLTCDYRWPQEIYTTMCTPPTINPEFFGQEGKKPNARTPKTHGRNNQVLGKSVSRAERLLYVLDRYMRTQARVASLGFHILTAMNKGIKGEQEVSSESLERMIAGMGRCLTDITETAMRGSMSCVGGRRQMWVDSMELNDSEAKKKLLHIPPKGMKLFGDETSDIVPEPSKLFAKVPLMATPPQKAEQRKRAAPPTPTPQNQSVGGKKKKNAFDGSRRNNFGAGRSMWKTQGSGTFGRQNQNNNDSFLLRMQNMPRNQGFSNQGYMNKGFGNQGGTKQSYANQGYANQGFASHGMNRGSGFNSSGGGSNRGNNLSTSRDFMSASQDFLPSGSYSGNDMHSSYMGVSGDSSNSQSNVAGRNAGGNFYDDFTEDVSTKNNYGANYDSFSYQQANYRDQNF